MSQRARVLSSGEAEFCVLNLGCAAESLVRNCWTWMQLERVNFDGQTRNAVSTARGAAKRSGKRTCKHVEVNTQYLRCDNEDVVGTDAAVPW